MLEMSIAKLRDAVCEIVGSEGMTWQEKRDMIYTNVPHGPLGEFWTWFDEVNWGGPDIPLGPDDQPTPAEPLDPEG